MINANKFWSNTRQEGDCLIWTGPTNQEPVYGIFSVLGGRLIAHRVAYSLSIGNLQPHSHVGRTCNNPLCVSPKHLFLHNANKSDDPSIDAKRKIESSIDTSKECWLWKGNPPKCLKTSTGLKTLPRAIFEIYNNPIPRGKEVVQTCQTEGCLNPKHLSLVNKSDLGKSNAKLNLEQVQEIRQLAHTGEYGLIELADRFSTSRQTIYTIVYNIGWKDDNYVPPAKMPRKPRYCRKGHRLTGNNVSLESGIRKCRLCREEEMAKKVPKKSLEDRFWEKVYKGRDCWDWTAYSYKGWGYFNVNRTPQLAHRVAYELKYGPIPDGAKVLHTCNNGLCCNPNHLMLDHCDKIAAK